MIKIIKDDTALWDEIEHCHTLFFSEYVQNWYSAFLAQRTDSHAQFVKDFINPIFNNLCLCNLSDMDIYISDFKNRFKSTFNKNLHKDDTDLKAIKEYLNQIYDYGKFSKNENILSNHSKKEHWNRHTLLSAIPVKICPYCNRTHISSYADEEGKQKTTADCDHFFNKATYPFLALSLYNFIPSCGVCNERFKLAIDFHKARHLYPYDRCFDSAGVSFATRSTDSSLSYLTKFTHDFEIMILNPSDDSEAGNSIKTFRLKELYQSHKCDAIDVIEDSIIYSKSQKKEFQSTGLFSGESEIERYIPSRYVYDSTKNPSRPLRKLINDIFLEVEEYIMISNAVSTS